MKMRELEVFAEDSNYAIIRASGRRFPGSLIQGDSLSHLCMLVRLVAQRVADAGLADEELRGNLQELQDLLIGRLAHYQRVLERHGIPLPYGNDPELLQSVPLVQYDDPEGPADA